MYATGFSQSFIADTGKREILRLPLIIKNLPAVGPYKSLRDGTNKVHISNYIMISYGYVPYQY